MDSSEHSFEEIRIIKTVRYFAKPKKDIIYKTEKNIFASNKNFMDYTLFLIT
jgi:hypothetical protein